MRPFFGYYGGKWRNARKHYPSPSEAKIVEPFAGSAGYSLRYPALLVTLYDVDPIVCGVWDYLVKVSSREVRNLPDVPEGGSVADMPIPQEARWLVGFWVNRGTATPKQTPSKWMREGTRPGSFWGPRVREVIATQVEAIRHWRIINASYVDVSVERATWFVDPPYQAAGKHYRFGSALIDYAHLGEWCKGLPGQVMVCENEGATWLDFARLADVKTTRRGKRSAETLWLKED